MCDAILFPGADSVLTERRGDLPFVQPTTESAFPQDTWSLTHASSCVNGVVSQEPVHLTWAVVDAL